MSRFFRPIRIVVHSPVAFDTGPGNALIDVAVSQFTGNQQSYDSEGQMAKAGSG